MIRNPVQSPAHRNAANDGGIRCLSAPGKARTSMAGFNLTDLLVTLAVLSLLAAIAIPIVHRGRAKAHLAQCQANLQAVGRAVLMYAQEHRQTLPLLANSPAPGPWWWYKEQVKEYAGLSGKSSPDDKVFACPDDRGYGSGADSVPFCRSAKFDYTSYVLNAINLPGVPNIAGWEVSRVRQPAVTVLVREWVANAPLSWHESKTGAENWPFYSDARCVLGFVDGHVQFTKIYYDGMNPAYTRDPIGGYDYRYSGD